MFLLVPLFSWCQPPADIAHEAFMITRMVSRFHVEPRPVDEKFSADVFNTLLENSDPDRIYFTGTDLAKLDAYKKTLDKQILLSKTDFLALFTNFYQTGLGKTDSIIKAIAQKPFDFNQPGTFTALEDTNFANTPAALEQKLYKKIKAQTLADLADALPSNFQSLSPTVQKKYIDSAEAQVRKSVTSALKRNIENVLQNPHGIVQYVGNLYCQTIASCFDPHTEFFPPEEKENFESDLGNQHYEFGFKIKGDKNGGVFIDNLQPGSPAYKSGKLNKGDKFLSVQWQGKEAVDVSDISTDDFGELLDQSNHDTAIFSIKKADASVIKVSLQKQAISNDDEGRVKSFVLKGAYTIGYIYLPVFYEDWDSNNQGLNGCANDVGREILKLKKENIDGLILDLRYNGGGSAREATELAGLFIDAGPVQQEKGRDAKIFTLKDVNRGTLYDGPLVVMVNGGSASASEIVADALQDYHRAAVVGADTYGKATAQIVFPMDTTVTPDNISAKQTKDYLKITVSRLFRVNGKTAQFNGVHPDIVLPDLTDAYMDKEAGTRFALRPLTIAPNKYYKPYPPLPVTLLAQSVKEEIDTNKYFKQVTAFVAYAKTHHDAADMPLEFNEAVKAARTAVPNTDALDNIAPTKKFMVLYDPYEIGRMQSDSFLKEVNDEFSEQVLTDPAVVIAFDVLGKLKSL